MHGNRCGESIAAPGISRFAPVRLYVAPEADVNRVCRSEMKSERHVVLVAPEIHWNTGNAGRTCLAVGARLHLIQPLGFSLESRELKRAGLDYWTKVDLRVWESFDQFLRCQSPLDDEMVLLTKYGRRIFWQMPDSPRLFLVFGSETRGLPSDILERYRKQCFHIPVGSTIRSLNLSTAVGIALYESLRRPGIVHAW
jgi:tRNA (cytidine/uridine-2'-O-)-methyltransferase